MKKTIIIPIIMILLVASSLADITQLQSWFWQNQASLDMDPKLQETIFYASALSDIDNPTTMFMILSRLSGNEELQMWGGLLAAATSESSGAKQETPTEKEPSSEEPTTGEAVFDITGNVIAKNKECPSEIEIEYNKNEVTPEILSSMQGISSQFTSAFKKVITDIKIKRIIYMKECGPINHIEDMNIKIKEKVHKKDYEITLISAGVNSKASVLINNEEFDYKNLKEKSELLLDLSSGKEERLSLIRAKITSSKETSYNFPDVMETVILPKGMSLTYANGKVNILQKEDSYFYVLDNGIKRRITPEGQISIIGSTVYGSFIFENNEEKVNINGAVTITGEKTFNAHKNTEMTIDNYIINTNNEEVCYGDKNCLNYILDTPEGKTMVINGDITVKKDPKISCEKHWNFCTEHSPLSCPVSSFTKGGILIILEKNENNNWCIIEPKGNQIETICQDYLYRLYNLPPKYKFKSKEEMEGIIGFKNNIEQCLNIAHFSLSLSPLQKSCPTNQLEISEKEKNILTNIFGNNVHLSSSIVGETQLNKIRNDFPWCDTFCYVELKETTCLLDCEDSSIKCAGTKENAIQTYNKKDQSKTNFLKCVGKDLLSKEYTNQKIWSVAFPTGEYETPEKTATTQGKVVCCLYNKEGSVINILTDYFDCSGKLAGEECNIDKTLQASKNIQGFINTEKGQYARCCIR